MTKTPERTTVSIPPECPIDLEQLDRLVEESEATSRSEYIRRAIMEQADADPDAE